MISKQKTKLSNRLINVLLLGIILIIACILRLYNFNNPVSDLSSKEQSQVLTVASTIENGGGMIGRYEESLLEKKLPRETKPLYNPSRLLLYEAKTALLHKLVPFFSLDLSGRVVSIFSSLVLISCVYFLCLRFQNRRAALFAGLFIACAPFFVLLSRKTTYHVTTIAISMIGIILLYLSNLSKRNNQKSFIYLIVSLFFTSLAVAVSPMTMIFILPILYLFYQRHNLDMFHSIPVVFYIIVSILPTFLINFFAGTLPQLLPLPIWANQIEILNQTSGIIFFQKDFVLTMLNARLIQGILGGLGIAFVGIGLFIKHKKTNLFHFFALSGFLSLVIFPHEQFTMISLQSFFIPGLALYFGVGVSTLITNKKEYSVNFFSFVLVCLFLIGSIFLSWQQVKQYFVVNQNAVQIANILETITQESDLIATDTKGDPILLYLANRRGVPTTDNGDTELKMAGIKYLVTSNSNYATTLSKQYKPVFKSKNAFIFDLTQ